MKKLLLHVGTHKTGTTSLQQFMQDNRELFLLQGLCVPKPTGRYPYCLRNRTAAFLRMAARRALNLRNWDPKYEDVVNNDWQYIKNAIAQYEAAYLSDERIWYEAAKTPGLWATIKQLTTSLGFDEVETIVYLRRQDLYAQSLWAQFVKGRESLPIDQYVNKHAVKQSLDYFKVLSQMEEVFDKDHIVVRIFEKDKLVEGDICHDFCEAINLEWDDRFSIPEALNPSLSNNVIEIKRIANSTKACGNTTNFLRQPALDTSAASESDNRSFFTNLERKEFLARYEKGNAELAKHYLDSEDGELFEPAEYSTIDWTPMTPEMLHDICYFFSEALAVEHERTRILEKKVRLLEEQAKEQKSLGQVVTNNPLIKKVKRFVRNAKN